MPRCPNCGRETARTEDWACQWCGYPLPRGSYKIIPMTYKQLREEMLSGGPNEELEAPPPAGKKSPKAKPAPEPPIRPASQQSPGPKGASESELTKWAEFKESLHPRRTAGPVFPAKPPYTRPASQDQPASNPAEAQEHTSQPQAVTPPPQPQPVAPPEQPQHAPPPQTVAPPPQPQYAPQPVPAYVAPAPQPPPPPRSILTGTLPDVVDVTVEELNLAYNTDAPATDARLAGKTLRITGVVERVVVKELFDIQYVLLAGAARQTWNVRCSFEKANARDLERVTEGQTSTVQGKFDGRQKNIILNNCALVR
ncbi:MAG: hypothetical protein HYX79_07760 [Chloroflexi bacterium]|nr:hypothetical protein [Chloroflexota bacterium]